MIKRKLKPFVIPTVYVVAICLFATSLYLMSDIIKSISLKESSGDLVDDSVLENTDNTVPVVSTDVTILRPYLDGKATLFKEFYNSEAEEEKQVDALYLYEGTYMQNTGSDYKADEAFDILSILDGTVTKIEENEVLGTSVEIKHSNDLISTYQSISDVLVKEGDTILAGQIIAKSGKCNLNPDINNMLHFELSFKGMLVNPEEYFNKSLGDL